MPVFDREKYASAEGTARGAYVLADSASGQPDVILIGTGSEVQIAVHARELLAAEGISARVVSMPCAEWFHEQDASYQEEVLPAAVRARVSVEAGITAPWKQFVGDAGESVGVDHYGASASLHEAVRGVRADGGAGRRSRQDQLVQDQELRSLTQALASYGRNTAMSDVLRELTEAGVSVWLDDISRDRLRTGNLEMLIKDF